VTWLAAVAAVWPLLALVLWRALLALRAARGPVEESGDRLAAPAGAMAEAARALAEARTRSQGVRAALDRRAGSQGSAH
jgi:hypothetical protein